MSRVVHPPRPVPAPAITVNLHHAAGNWAASRQRARALVDWEDWRERARAIRADAVAHLPELLEEFEQQVVARGGAVHHARTGDEAARIVATLCGERGLARAIKGKSMLSEEVGLNAALAAAGVEVVETDLGEYIVQLLEDRPSHLLAPAVHLSAAQVAELFSARAGTPLAPDDTQALVDYARAQLRAAFLAADVGITGVNMAVAATGTLILVESEGNIRLSSGLPRVHIALMGIEKVLRDWDGAAHLVKMLPLAAHGRPTATYTSFVTGPARDGDDGPEELHVVLVDDGRSAVRGTELESVLHCIRCGACLYACPVYRQIGGHAYGSTYSGPIGAVLTPALDGARDGTGELAWLSSLCGACSEACPVKIPLDEQLVAVRAMNARQPGHSAERALYEAWSRLWSKPAGYRATAATGGRALAPAWSRLVSLRTQPSGEKGQAPTARSLRAQPGGERGQAPFATSLHAQPTEWVARVPFPFSGWTQERDMRAPAKVPFHVRWKRARG